jgi:hypothetical protein
MSIHPRSLLEKVEYSNYKFLVTMDSVCHILNHNRADTETLLYLGNRLNTLLYPETPTLENWKDSRVPVRPALSFVPSVEEMTFASFHAGNQLVHDYDENPFQQVVRGISDPIFPRWGEELTVQAEFHDYQERYYKAAGTGNAEVINRILDQMVALTCNCDDPEHDLPEARFMEEEQTRFNDSLEHLKNTGVLVDETNSLRLSKLGEEKGYFTGFTPYSYPSGGLSFRRRFNFNEE